VVRMDCWLHTDYMWFVGFTQTRCGLLVSHRLHAVC
jgi:hypothetical protein